MPRTESTTPHGLHALLAAAADLMNQRATHTGTGTGTAPTITLCMDEAPTVFADAPPETQQLLRDIAQSGRANGIRLKTQNRILGRHCRTAAELNAAAEQDGS